MTDATGIYGCELPGLDRTVQLGIAQGRVLSLSFPTQLDADAQTDHELLERIVAFFSGEQDDFSDVVVALTVPTPQREILETLRTVPYGETVSMAQLLRMTPGDHDPDEHLPTVQNALVGNPLPVLIPTHRVSDGPSALPPGVETAVRSVEGI